jgi:hypothetical protein
MQDFKHQGHLAPRFFIQIREKSGRLEVHAVLRAKHIRSPLIELPSVTRSTGRCLNSFAQGSNLQRLTSFSTASNSLANKFVVFLRERKQGAGHAYPRSAGGV